MVTMQDVARAAGVSAMTVSNVLAGRGRVSDATRRTVLAEVERLGYEVDLSARRLRAGRTGAIALVVPFYDHVFYGEFAADAARAAAAAGLHLVVEQTGATREGELRALSTARLRTYDGVLLSPIGLSDADLDRLHTRVPVVLLGERPSHPRFDHVAMPNVDGACLATARLIEGGARRVAICGGDPGGSDTMPALRAEGWRLAHERAGLAADPRLALDAGDHTAAGARAGVARALGRGAEVDAIFAVTDQVAIGAVAGLADAGLAAGADVEVIGFDNLRIAREVAGGISTIDPGSAWIAERAVALLRARIDGSTAPPAHLTSSATLVERATTRDRARTQGRTR
ncbi:LacI family DNA-binding transcriptional regulator [Microbacterium excoecariae]|uniref:LacI family DNA-binding transcriptional regulator n=1 Tax=Microbacterium excoecariae TaxID=2715210 RepID=UPI00140BA1B4|nr:LacI family DNA-binding transcriptional regulator [Microbacterium excoecariae]NHI16449.1 LacI family transcriptional regulator [Microbacterium excoecariae]